jgi:hypothetical protein
MSLVALGPLMKVIGRTGSSTAKPSGTLSTTSATRTTHTCMSPVDAPLVLAVIATPSK